MFYIVAGLDDRTQHSRSQGTMLSSRAVNDHSLLNRAFELGDDARRDGDHPFGAPLAVDGEIVADQIAAGALGMTNRYWQKAREFSTETAAEYGIATARLFNEFMGSDGTEDPPDAGLVTADHLHPTEAGSMLIAELIHDLGYDFAE